MTQARLIRRVRFRASHHYARREWSEEKNREVFGDQMDPHEHDWTVEVQVAGPVDPESGFVVDLGAVDGAMAAVMAQWDGGDLNALIPEVTAGTMQPSTESLARWLHRQLEGRVPAPARLTRVTVWESPDLGARFPA
jgi:6-pyruvoyltetrahydropterin/6-carboxytetrahydropterin synthase